LILADTSVWIDHFRRSNPSLERLLRDGEAVTHPFVIGELACGSMKNREALLEYLMALPRADSASHEEVLRLIEDHRLWRRGIGWTDAHLLASALLSRSGLWTLDRRLAQAAAALGLQGI
jgi:predicted nucleic acid-binding protein